MKNKQSPKMVATVWRHWSPVFKNYWISLSILSISYILALYAELLKPTAWKDVFDLLLKKELPWIPFIWIGIYALISWILNRIGFQVISYCESGIIQDLKNYALKGLLTKSTDFFNSHSSGAMVAKAKRFAAMSENVIDQLVFTIFRSVFLVAYLLIFTLMIIPKLSIVFFVWVSLFVLFVFIVFRIRTKHDLASANADSKTTGEFSDIILSIFTLRIFSSLPRENRHFKETTKVERKLRLKTWNISNVHLAVQSLLMLALETCVMYIVILDVISGEQTIGTAVMIQSYIVTLASYMYNLGQSLSKIRSSIADAYEMSALLDEVGNEKIESDESLYVDESIFKRNICFEDVEFSYPKGEEILKKFNFTFEGGRHYGIVGHSGAGKSTVVKLLLRIHEATDGQMYFGKDLDIVKLNNIEKNQIRSMISYVPQNHNFPNRKVRDLVALGKEHATDNEIMSALAKAKAEFVWEKLPDGLNTLVGEKGIKLSGGEAQRIAIASAILKDAPIVIMDEPTSALDSITECSIQESIRDHFKDKTLIVIAHRLSTVAVLDEVVLMDDGEVLKSGKHDDLLEMSPIYREMWDRQTNPMIV